MRYLCVATIFFLVFISVSSTEHEAFGSIIDFESIPGGLPTDGLPISTQFLASHGVSFSLEGGGFPVLAKVGRPETAFRGYNDLPDQPAPGTDVGQFFLTDDGVLAGSPAPLLINYATPVSAAGGVLLDIDVLEAWKIEAFDVSGYLVATIDLGPNNDLNGSATPWGFHLETPEIASVRLSFTGSGKVVGLAFDNFTPTSASPTPLPPGIFLIGSAFIGIGVFRYKFRKG